MSFNFDWNIVSGGGPNVTISKNGVAFNSAAMSKLGNPEQVVIGFDEEAFVLGVRPFYEGDNGRPYKFKNREDQSWARIGCREFLNYLQGLGRLDIMGTARRYTPAFDENGTMVIHLMNEKGKQNSNFN